jgi:hypothetical protein
MGKNAEGNGRFFEEANKNHNEIKSAQVTSGPGIEH